MQLIRRFLRRGQRGSVSVEFAIIATFFLLPLLAGAADFICIITAQAQLNTSLQALYFFAWTNPTAASTTSDLQVIITAINKTSNFTITLPATLTKAPANVSVTSGAVNGIASVGCFLPPAASTTTFTYAATTCPTGDTTMNLVTYEVKTSVSLPFPLPLKIANPFVLTAIGTVQTS
jgi:Flp pilus assembly protein TadG